MFDKVHNIHDHMYHPLYDSWINCFWMVKFNERKLMIGNNFIMKDPLDSENAKELEKKMNDPFTKKLDISMDKIHLNRTA